MSKLLEACIQNNIIVYRLDYRVKGRNLKSKIATLVTQCLQFHWLNTRYLFNIRYLKNVLKV